MKSIFKYTGLLALAMALATPVFTACDNDDFDTNQYVGGVSLNSFGPSPVARGGELRFLGSGLNQIVKVSIPGCDDITDITVISSEEIRVTVPQTAEPGKVQLHYANGLLETKSMLTYSEPISIEEITPATVKPGAELTISGEYLNLIKEVSFSFLADSVNVYAADFKAHDRKQIVVTVPEEAVSGTIIISDAKEVPNTIKSEQTIEIVLPSVTAPLDLTNAKGGDAVTVKGKDLDLVRTILMPDETEVKFTYNADDSSVSFTLPENASDGAIVAVPASGVKVAIANIGMVVPTELVATPAEGLRGGDEITIAGVNIDQVTSISFPNVEEAVTPAEIKSNALKVVFPAMAQSGNAVLNLKSGKTVEVALATAKPEVTGFEPSTVAAAADVKLIGRNLDLIATMEFTGAEAFEVTATSATECKVNVPATANSGPLTLTMANGETVATPELTVQAPECAFITVEPEGELTAYGLFVAGLKNADKLTEVKVNGETVNHIVNGDQLYITLPGSCGKGTVITLISSNGEISYTYDVTPATHQERVLLSTPITIGNWDDPRIYITHTQLAGVPEGAKLVFYIEPANDTQLQLNDSGWGQFIILEPAAGDTKIEFTLTAQALEAFSKQDGNSDNAIIIQGKNCTVNKITVEWEISLETQIWSGSWDSGNWGGNQDLAWGGYDWSTVKAGQTLRLYFNQTDTSDSWYCISLRHGQDWGNIGGSIPDQYDTPSSPHAVVLDQATIDDLVANGGLIITGANFTLTKVTIE